MTHWYRDKQKAEAEQRRLFLSDLMADGHTLSSAAAVMGVTNQLASAMWKIVVASFGQQAA